MIRVRIEIDMYDHHYVLEQAEDLLSLSYTHDPATTVSDRVRVLTANVEAAAVAALKSQPAPRA